MQIFDKNTTGMHWHWHKMVEIYDKYRQLVEKCQFQLRLVVIQLLSSAIAPLPKMLMK